MASTTVAPRAAAAATQRIKAAPKKAAPAPKTGTQRIVQKPTAPVGGGTKKITAISVGKKGADFRATTPGGGAGSPPPRILARVQQLRLLSKAEAAGLLSAAERAGVTLSALEKSGALSAAESLGLLSRAADRSTPGLLYALATALFVAGPAVVYAVPDTSAGLVALQALAAGAAIVGGSAAWGGASLLSALQK